MNHRRKSARKLSQILQTAFFLLPFLATLTVGIFSYSMFSKTMTEQIAVSRIDVLRQISDRTTAIFDSIYTISSFYYYNLPTFDNSIESQPDTQDIITKFSQLDHMIQETVDATGLPFYYVLALNNGFSYSSKGESEAFSFEAYQKKLWYADLIDTDNAPVLISTYKDFSQAGEYVFSLAYPLFNPDTLTPVGIFTFNISETVLLDTYQNLIKDNTIYMIDQNGRIISHSNRDMLAINFYNMKRFSEIFANNSFQIIHKNNIPFLFSNYFNTEHNWWMIEEIPLSSLLAPLNRLKYMTIGACIIVFIFSVFLSRYLSRRIVQPLSQLCTELEQIGRQETQKSFQVSGWQEIESICIECNYMSQRITALLDDIKRKENAKRHAELEFLQAQMNPHFIYNTLFSIKCLVDMDNKEKAIGILDSFTSILKNTLSYKSKFITIHDELTFLKDYIILQKYRYGDTFDYEVTCPSELEEKKILRMIIQPLIENSIFHGFAGIQYRGRIKLNFFSRDSILFISLSDNGHGFSKIGLEKVLLNTDHTEKNANSRSNFIGLHNIIERIHLHFGADYGISIDSNSETGTTIIIKLPLEPRMLTS